MPKFKESTWGQDLPITETEKQLNKSSQTATTGISVMTGIIEEDNLSNPLWQELQEDYWNIYFTDSVVKTSLVMLLSPIESAGYTLQEDKSDPDSVLCKQYVEYVISNLIDGFTNFKKHCLLAIPFGVQMFEVVFSIEKYMKKVVNRVLRMVPMMNKTIDRFYYNDYVDFVGIRQRRIGKDNIINYIDIGLDSLFHVTHDMLYNDVRGNSELRAVRLAAKLKEKILIATSRRIERGAGIPTGEYKGNITPAEEAAYKMLLRNIANSKNVYAFYNGEKFKMNLNALTDQQDAVPVLEFLNREIFFNTLTQFLTSGLGQNGSRAATGELKSPYEIKLDSIKDEEENYFQWFVNIIIDNSYFSSLPYDKRPKFKFNTLIQSDILKAAQSITTFAANGLTLTDQDWIFIRNLLGLPDNKQIVEVEGFTNPEGKQEPAQLTKLTKKKEKRELTKWELEIFEMESANNTFLAVQDRAENAIQEVYKKMLNDIKQQFIKTGKTDFDVRYGNELKSKLIKIYNDAKSQGKTDMSKEISKISKTKDIKLEKILLTTDPNVKKIDRYVTKFVINVNSTLSNELDSLTDNYIADKGVDSIFDSFLDSFKTDKRSLITLAQTGYQDGRGEVMESDNTIKEYAYTAIFDENLCDHCSPLDNYILTRDEINNSSNLSFYSPINLNCLGGDHCRCAWIPVSL